MELIIPIATVAVSFLTAAGGLWVTRRGKQADERSAAIASDIARRESLWGELQETLQHQREHLATQRAELEQHRLERVERSSRVLEHQVWDRALYMRLVKAEGADAEIDPPPPLD